MVLEKETTIVKSSFSNTQYLTIPASIVTDSQYPFFDVTKVLIKIDVENKQMIIKEVLKDAKTKEVFERD